MSYASQTGRFHVALALLSLLGIGVSASGCIEDADCGVCDPDNLIVESISGVNYTSDKIHLLSPPCEGDQCPKPFSKGSYFIEDIGPCEDTEEAQATPSPEEYCKISPLITAFGIEFVFNNLLDAQSIELVRKRPDNPQLFEVYDWKTDVLHIEGPITRWNGDYARGAREEPDVMSRMVNLSCVDNLRGAGVGFNNENYEDPATNPCNDMVGDKPNKMFEEGTISSYRGVWSAWGSSCSSPQEGPDTCCTFCEWLLATKVERYGIDPNGVPRNPLMGALIEGDPARPYAPAIVCREGESDGTAIDTYSTCAGFIPSIDRSDEEQRWEYEWCDPSQPPGPNCATTVQSFPLPLVDKLRETHPDLRPLVDSKGREYEKRSKATGGAFCRTTVDCGADGHNLAGTTCMGVNDDTKLTCLADAYPEGGCSIDGEGAGAPEAVGGFCRPSWTTICADNADTIGGTQAYCTDRRYGTTGSAACKITTAAVEDIATYGGNAGFKVGCEDDGTNCAPARAGKDRELAYCDWNENGRLTAAECCVSSIAGPTQAGMADGGFACDPFYQSNLVDKPLYQRDTNLPEQTKNCKCPTSGSLAENEADLDEQGCLEPVATGCYDEDGELREERAGDFAVKFVTRVGGIVYDPAVKGIDWRPADTGGVPRADIEQCAMDNVDRLIAPLNRHDGWRAQDPYTPENFEDFDRAMCSGQQYTVVFNTPGNEDNPSYVVDKVGNTLEGKSVYTFETPQFHVVPGSGFPTDNLRIGACDDYSIRFSNKYDVSPENLNKLQLYRVECTEEMEGGMNVRTCEWAAPDARCDRDINGDGVADPPPGACCDPVSDAEPFFTPVAGGPGCAQTQDELTAMRAAGDQCARPCLTVDVENQFIGEVGLRINPTEFGQVLGEDQVYRMIVPAVGSLEDAAANAAVYDGVFWDVCGMPLTTSNAVSYTYEFKIDEPKCKEDQDRDGIPFSCDNADTNFNPTQADIDADGIGDITDLCPVAGGDPNNTADSDNDGVGNVCDTCRQTLDQYNDGAELIGVPSYMQVRNIPYQDDFDEDGIGDVCDNCVKVPNCEGFGNEDPLTPYRVGDPIAYTDDDVCQRDTNGDFIGDLCLGMMAAGAAGMIGFGNDDDFDQDGITNMLDSCPRQPLADAVECAGPDECPENRTCDDGLCNHLDSDNDGVGNQCDTCPFSPNPNQVLEGGMQEDDADEDFVGSSCETAPACGERKDARPFGFYQVQAFGNCCTSALIKSTEFYDDPDDRPEDGIINDVAVGDLLLAGTCENAETTTGATCTPLRAPHPENSLWTLPVRAPEDCPEEQSGGVWLCRQLRPAVAAAPGILTPPPGCEDALADFDEGAGLTALENLLAPLTDDDFGDQNDPFDALWQNLCFLPQVDQDYDGLGDPCDLCPFAFDPENTQYIDINGRLWPNDGGFCNGEYLPDNICDGLMMGVMGMDESGSGSGSGSSSGSGSGSGGGSGEAGSGG